MTKCAICGRIKGQNNHWWTLEFNPTTKSFFEYPFDNNPFVDEKREFKDDYEEIHTCGIECLLIAESKIRSGADPVRRIPE